MPVETNDYKFSDVPVGKLMKYRNFLRRIQEDPDCRDIESKLHAVFTLAGRIDYVSKLVEEINSK